MEIFRDDTEFTGIQMVQRVVDMFERRPRMQRIIRCGLLGIEYEDDLDVTDDDDDDDYETDSWVHCQNNFPDSSDRELSVNHTSSTHCQSPRCNYYGWEPHYHQPSIKLQEDESDTEREAKLLQDEKKSKEQAEKKRLKKQKQKERRRQKKLDQEKLNPVKKEEGTDDPQLSKADKRKQVNAKSKDGASTRVKEPAAAKDTESSDGSENESSEKDSDKDDSGDSEELDLTSTFVSKAALIARRKLEQSRPERKEKKKVALKEETKTVPGKPNENQDAVKKDSAEPSSPTFEDNVKISTDIAVIGNQYASAGNYNMAVKYFTDAIKYNPTEFKLFGNRSFCFEKMQEYEKALTDAELSLSMYPGWVKGLFRKGRALAGLKRYEEASKVFREVLKMDSACAEAAQELMRVQITQLMEYGFTREQSSNALIIHGTVNKALEVLFKLKQQAGAVQNGTLPPVQVANVTGTSPVLSANTTPAPAFPPPPPPPTPPPPQSKEATTTLKNKPLGPVQNMSNVPSEPKPISKQAVTSSEDKRSPPELFPVWVGNLFHQVSESMITNLFNKVGAVYSTKLLTSKRCAFVNFTKQEDCDEAIRRFNGFELMGIKIAVRYPDRIPHGMGISKSALKAEDLQDENMWQRDYADRRNAGEYQRPFRPYRHVPSYRGPYSY
ncbi:leiomodin-1-like isoform X2 [Scomber japonicus]|uniref:leiomodin-1-like isoform X2 n=1 Tax=Scomber japonicus TaxID=13676 RepID=UPI0023062BC0|nr:leiomodin-1-like isoform X2 [Scomber japonicus]